VGPPWQSESVWVGWFFTRRCKPLRRCATINDQARGDRYREHLEKLKRL